VEVSPGAASECGGSESCTTAGEESRRRNEDPGGSCKTAGTIETAAYVLAGVEQPSHKGEMVMSFETFIRIVSCVVIAGIAWVLLIIYGATWMRGMKIVGKAIFRERPTTNTAAPAKRVGFFHWIFRYLVAHAFWSLLVGSTVMWWIVKHAGTVMLLCFALILRGCGGNAELPSYAQEDEQSIGERVKGWFGEKTDAIKEKLQEEKRKLREEFDERRERLMRRKVTVKPSISVEDMQRILRDMDQGGQSR
jgi:hypothetical protein